MMASRKIFISGQEISGRIPKRDIGEAKLVIFCGDGEIYAFQNQRDFQTHFRSHFLYKTVLWANKCLTLASRSQKEIEGSSFEKKLIKKIEGFQTKYVRTLKSERVNENSFASLRNYNCLFNPAKLPPEDLLVLYQNNNYTGRRLYLPKGAAIGKLGWFNYNNQASSARIFMGNAILCDKTWFRGKKIFLWGYPFGQFNSLGAQFGFNDRATSVWHF